MFARADSSPSLPRLGGMARPDGVIVASERYWALARTDGSLEEGSMPTPARAWRRVPVIRGLVRLASAVTPLFRGRGVAARPERLLLALTLPAPLGFVVLPHDVRLWVGLALAAALILWIFRGRTRHLHGAEHRALAAVESRRLCATWVGDARPTRFALRCGTNFSVLVFVVAALADRVWPLPATAWTPAVIALLSLGLTMELWVAIEGSGRRVAQALLMPGIGLQRLTTKEPTLDETRVALRAAASVLRRELA